MSSSFEHDFYAAAKEVTSAGMPVASPTNEDEARELLHFAAKDKLKVLPRGNGTSLTLEEPRPSADFIIDTTKLSGIIAFEPSDGTVTAFAGTTMASIAELAAGSGRRLCPDLAHTTSTLGGAIASGRTGEDRLRYGPMRDQVLGLRALLSADISSKSGGRLVKNVAGYDVHRAHCGGRGRYGLVIEATLRLHPALPRELHLKRNFESLEVAIDRGNQILATTCRPLNIRIWHNDHETSLHIHLGGRDDVVAAEQQLLDSTIGDLQVTAPRPKPQAQIRLDCPISQTADAASWIETLRKTTAAKSTHAGHLIADLGIASVRLATDANPQSGPSRQLNYAGPHTPPKGCHLFGAPQSESSQSAPISALKARIEESLDTLGIFAR
ncbi:MAG: glycolate oxidase FAD binding subunit [Planctomycetota bacterium]|jgi:glycolate oxidase FAD binding subunit